MSGGIVGDVRMPPAHIGGRASPLLTRNLVAAHFPLRTRTFVTHFGLHATHGVCWTDRPEK